MKLYGIGLAAITLVSLFPSQVERFAQHDAIGPVLGLTVALAAVALVIFALPVKTRR